MHALVQHGYNPDGYPLFRLVADLQALGADFEALRQASRFLRDFDPDDLRGISVLLEALGSGNALDLPDGPSRSLVHHIIAAHLDSGYALGLKASPRALRAPSDLPAPLATLRWAYMVTVLSRAQVDEIYGPQTTAWGYASRQLLRPLDLARRTGRSSWAAWTSARASWRRQRHAAKAQLTDQRPLARADHEAET